jgi:LDH2 family malate/lactate/ureidoglycolate dehydrogenase
MLGQSPPAEGSCVSKIPVFVRHGDLAQFIVAAFVAKGMAADHADIIADALVWANLRGGDSHGVVRLPRYVELIDRGEMDPAARPDIVLDGPLRFVLDGMRCAGPIAMMRAIAIAGDRAMRGGLCVGLVRNTTHTGAIGRYAHAHAERGCIALIAVAGIPLMAYHGARVRSVSTSPLAIGVPTGREPVVLDMATSVAALGRLVQARAAGDPIPAGWAIAENGSPTTDPKAAAIPLPLGGPKGSGLSLMFEFMAGLLSGAPGDRTRAGTDTFHAAHPECIHPCARRRRLSAAGRVRCRCERTDRRDQRPAVTRRL